MIVRSKEERKIRRTRWKDGDKKRETEREGDERRTKYDEIEIEE